jgi:DNA replication protein DnaC
MTDSPIEELKRRAAKLGLWGLMANWEKLSSRPWLPELLGYEETERARKSLERRVKSAKIGAFKPMADFDWHWPKEIDQEQIEEVLQLHFVTEPANVILVGPNGVGKTMIAKNIIYKAILQGYTARVISASELLNDLAAQTSSWALTRRLRHYCHPQVLLIDELGYLATSTEHANLLFEVISRRYQQKPVILTTNKAFTDWGEVFPNSTCVVTLIDRLVHKAEILKIKGSSYRLKEARERAASKKELRAKKTSPNPKPKK